MDLAAACAASFSQFLGLVLVLETPRLCQFEPVDLDAVLARQGLVLPRLVLHLQRIWWVWELGFRLRDGL